MYLLEVTVDDNMSIYENMVFLDIFDILLIHEIDDIHAGSVGWLTHLFSNVLVSKTLVTESAEDPWYDLH